MKYFKIILSVLVVCYGLTSGAQVNDSANKGKKANFGGIIVNTVVGVGLASASCAVCGAMKNGNEGGVYGAFYAGQAVIPCFGAGPTCQNVSGVGTIPVSMALSAFSVLSYTQAAMNMMKMAQSSKTGETSSYGAGGYDSIKYDDITFPDGSVMTGADFQQGLSRLDQAMKKNGMGLDLKNGKVTMPNGKSFDSSLLASGNSGAIADAMGLPKDAVEKAMDLANKATKDQLSKFKNYDLKMAGGGGGGSGIGGAASERNPAGLGLDLSALFGKKAVAAAKVSGLSKNVGGNPVGVAQDDIFQMVQRRYQEKSKDDFFYK